MTKKNQMIKAPKADSFEDLYNRDKEEVSKDQKKKTARAAKRAQLVLKVSDLNNRAQQAEIAFQNSLINPNVCSTEKAIALKVIQEEYKVTMEIFTKLFPEDAAKLLTNEN